MSCAGFPVDNFAARRRRDKRQPRGPRRQTPSWGSAGSKRHEGACVCVCVDPPTPTSPPTSLFKHHWSELGHPPPAPQMIKTSAARSENIERNDFTQVAVRWVGSCFTFGEKRVFSSTFFFFADMHVIDHKKQLWARKWPLCHINLIRRRIYEYYDKTLCIICWLHAGSAGVSS